MGKNTDALVDTCSKLALALDPLAKKIAGEIKQINERTATLKKTAVPRQGEKLLRKSDAAKWLEELKELKSDRNVLAKDLGSLQNSALRNATKAAKDLESKIKKKDFLNFFKTQQSLDNAKKALKQSQQAIDKTEERLTAFNTSYTSIDDHCDSVTDILKKSLKEGLEEDGRKLRPHRKPLNQDLVQEWTDKLKRQLTKTIPNGLAMLESFQAVADKKAEVFKKLSSQIGKTKTWPGDTRKPMMKQIEDEMSTLEKLTVDRLPAVISKVQLSWNIIDDLPRNILSLPEIRQLIKKLKTAEASVATFGDTLDSKLQTLREHFGNLWKDLATAGNDDNLEDIEQGLEDIEYAKSALLDKPGRITQEFIDEGKNKLIFLVDLAKKRDPVTEDDWKELQSINSTYGLSGKLEAMDWIRKINNAYVNAEGLAHRFKKNADIQNAYKDYRTAYKTSKKTADTYVKLQDEIYKRSSKLVEKTLSSK